MKEELVERLLDFPSGHPYAKWTGTHWRLVEIADSGIPVPRARLEPGVASECAWLLPGLAGDRVLRVAGLPLRHASIEGNAVHALTRLGYAGDERTRQLVDALLEWQWPDGGWNCDRHHAARRSSFHESTIPALALAEYATATGDVCARRAAERTAELLLEHRLFRSRATGAPIHPSWTVLHYPSYWHYDVLIGLRLLAALGRLDDPRANDAFAVVEHAHDGRGRFSGRTWASSRQPHAVDWGRGRDNLGLNGLAAAILAGRERSSPGGL
ncbi:hypothetical protein EXU48_00190 [Occultella glacieicola]|uniref:Prenyltransferase n=1 Tax=Occultella glacieicola TaxID=2518684 RepID=A0ABY2ED13_9MICO|nr:hypothetical protein [Occultella glacieicola]TDE98677.1 hypothetical protein EXU48_00190 [Occultella glacieicola]